MLLLSRIKELITANRAGEMALMTGFSFVGLLFADSVCIKQHPTILLFVIGYVFVFVASVYSLNSYADYENDIRSERLKGLAKISSNVYWKLLVIGVVAFVLLSIMVNIYVLAINLAAFLFWLLYYLPPLRLKTTFGGGTLIHFGAGILHFHSCYCAFSALGADSLLISIFFAGLLSIGHVNHELLDFDDDLLNSQKTTTVRIGKRKAVLVRNTLILAVLIYLVILFSAGFLATGVFLLFFSSSLILFIISILTGQDNPLHFQKYSRALIFLMGLIIAGVKIISVFHA